MRDEEENSVCCLIRITGSRKGNLRIHDVPAQRAAQRVGRAYNDAGVTHGTDRCGAFDDIQMSPDPGDARQGLLDRVDELLGSLIRDGEDGGGEDGGVSTISMTSLSGGAGVLTTS